MAARRRRVPRVFIHVITDGRDTSPTGGVRYLAQLQDVLDKARDRPRRDDLRALLRDGSRQALGADQARLRRDRQRHRGADDQSPIEALQAVVRSRRHRRVRQTRSSSWTPTSKPIGPGPGRGLDRLLQFPGGSRAAADPRDRARRLRRLSASRSPARPLHHDDGVRPDVQPAGTVFTPQTFSGNLADVLADNGRTQPAAGRNGEVRARHLLLQLRARAAVPGRGPHPRPVAEGRDLRPQAGDERPGDHRRNDRRRSRPASTRS